MLWCWELWRRVWKWEEVTGQPEPTRTVLDRYSRMGGDVHLEPANEAITRQQQELGRRPNQTCFETETGTKPFLGRQTGQQYAHDKTFLELCNSQLGE